MWSLDDRVFVRRIVGTQQWLIGVLRCRYTFWSFTRHDVQVPVTYHAVPAGQASPLDTCAPLQ